MDPSTLRREDSPPDYLAFRESVINLLIHQDYADHNRKATIHFHKDRTVLQNPGDSFADPEQLLKPGEKPLRNPRIVSALRRIGLNEEAGTGFRVICRSWERLGNVPPVVDNDRGKKILYPPSRQGGPSLRAATSIPDNLGVRLSQHEAKAFAYVCRKGELRLRDVKAVAGLSARDAQAVLDRLLTEVLVTEVFRLETEHMSNWHNTLWIEWPPLALEQAG